MALSYVQYPGDGVTETFAVPFEYLDKTHLQVRVALDIHAFTWDDPNTIRITPAPASGVVVELRRVTPRENRMVDFVDGSVLTESDLDLANIQTFYIVQEAIDIAGGTLELLSDGSYGAGGRRIRDLGTAIDARDAITKEYHDGTFLPQMNALLAQTEAARGGAVTAQGLTEAALAAAIAARDLALAHRNAAEGFRNGAYTSEQNAYTHYANAYAAQLAAEGYKTEATTQAGASYVHRQASEAARDKAQQWAEKTDGPVETGKYSAKAWANDSQQYRNTALTYRNDAEGFKDAAAASAAAAATFAPANYYQKVQLYTKTETDTAVAAKFDKAGGTLTGRTKFGSISGSWTTGGWAVPLQFLNGQALHWTNGATSGGIGFSNGTFYVLNGPEAIDGTGAASTRFQVGSTGAWVNGNTVIHNGNIGGYIPSGIITLSNFTSYFTMRKTAWGQTSYVAAGNFTGGNYPGPAGTFMVSVALDATLQHSGYYYYLQWYWNGSWYTIQG